MIPANAPYQATYSHEHGGAVHYTDRPVIAWDDEGHALVVDEKTGQLRRASSWRNFHRVQEADPPVVAAVPADGWRAEFKQDDDSASSCPVVAWTVRSDGSCTPLDTDSTGFVDDPTTVGNFTRVYHQGEETR